MLWTIGAGLYSLAALYIAKLTLVKVQNATQSTDPSDLSH